MALSAMKGVRSMRQRLGQKQGWTYEVEVVAQHAAELPLPPGARVQFLLKRRTRLCVTEAEPVDAAGGVEWNTRCTQTATLFKDGDSWRPKEFGFKVQVVKGGSRLGQEAAQTVGKASLDLSQFCTAEPFGPKQLIVPLQPRGVLAVSVRTQWLRHYDAREADTLTDVSYLSLGQSVATSAAGVPVCGASEEDQDLSGFDSSGAAAAGAAAGLAGLALDGGGGGGGSIRAVYPSAAGGGAAAGSGAGGEAQALKKRLSSAVLGRLRPSSAKEQAGGPHHQRQHSGGSASSSGMAAAGPPGGFDFGRPGAGGGATAPAPLQRSFTAPALGSGGRRRPSGASLLQIPDASAAGAAAAAAEAATPTLFGSGRPPRHQQQQQQQQEPEQQDGLPPPAQGLPPECWSPINLDEAVEQLYDSEEEPTPKPSVLGTVKRMFGRARNLTPTPPGTTARQLHTTFNTPQPTPPRCTPNPVEIATIDREGSMSALRRRCKRLVAERDEARAEGFAEAALAVEQSVEIDKLRRSKDMLLQRLQVTEAQLLATYRDEASTDLIQALASARVEAAQKDFQIMEMQGQLRRRDALVDRLRAQLTRAEAKYRASLNALPSPPGMAASPCSAAASSAWLLSDAAASTSVAAAPDVGAEGLQQQAHSSGGVSVALLGSPRQAAAFHAAGAQ